MGRLSSEADKSKAELNKAFAALNVKPIHEIKEEIAQLNAAYNRLRQDGTVSAADLARAQGALQQKTAELTQQNGGWVESLSQVKGAIVGLSAQFLALGSAVNQAMDFQGLQ
ncbi:MAG TPA: hypothetical protein VJ001_08920, partial [Rhodocyclaceae bacterium]|nr:hypothetical protein [Rhodocyclaceae bacterium]